MRTLSHALTGCRCHKFDAAKFPDLTVHQASLPLAEFTGIHASYIGKGSPYAVCLCRVFAFLHQAMPGEPLVVLHTALTDSVTRSMRELLPPEAVAAAAAATSQ